MSATWLQALRAYATRKTPLMGTVEARRRLFDEVARIHLYGTSGSQRHPDGLPVLREVRWLLLREGSKAERAELLEHILKSYAEVSEETVYAGSSPALAAASVRRSGDDISGENSQPHTRRSAPVRPNTTLRGSTPAVDAVKHHARGALSDARLGDVSELQQLLLEQVQCLVEAKVSDIPLTARHYRYPMRSPLLATVSPELPLLLLEELTLKQKSLSGTSQSSSASSLSRMDMEWEARVDCCVGLAGAGHVRDAIELCGEDGSVFRVVMQRVARLRRDGWRDAWTLVEGVPLTRLSAAVVHDDDSRQLDWLRGVLEAAHLRYRAAAMMALQQQQQTRSGHGHSAAASSTTDASSDEVFTWVDRLCRVLLPSTGAGSTAALQTEGQRASPAARRLLVETYLSVCPPGRWRDAVGMVVGLFSEARVLDSKPGGVAANDRVDTAEVLAMGRVMAMLNVAEQPWMMLLFFYGDPLALRASRTVTPGISLWDIPDDVLQAEVMHLLQEARSMDRLTLASGATLSSRDTAHPAIYNHAMSALARTGHVDDAVKFYERLPAALTNRHTHWSLLHLFLGTQHCHNASAAASLRSSRIYGLCSRAVLQLLPCRATDAQKTAGDTNGGRSAPSAAAPLHLTREQGVVWESMSLWAAIRQDVETVLLCAAQAPPSCHYVRTMALLSTAAAAAAHGDAASTVAAWERLPPTCVTPQGTLKELCLTAAVLALFDPHPLLNIGAQLNQRSRLHNAVLVAMASHVGHSQSRMDELLQLLVDYYVSLRRRRQTPMTAEDVDAALDNILAREKMLASTMDLARPREGQAGGVAPAHPSADSDADSRDRWRSVACLAATLAARQGLSAVRAAPALVSAGAPADIAVELFSP